jgi:hypothetical protein
MSIYSRSYWQDGVMSQMRESICCQTSWQSGWWTVTARTTTSPAGLTSPGSATNTECGLQSSKRFPVRTSKQNKSQKENNWLVVTTNGVMYDNWDFDWLHHWLFCRTSFCVLWWLLTARETIQSRTLKSRSRAYATLRDIAWSNWPWIGCINRPS